MSDTTPTPAPIDGLVPPIPYDGEHTDGQVENRGDGEPGK